MSVIVTASNGWVHKPIVEADAADFMMCFKDYPLSQGANSITYEERVHFFSATLQRNEANTLPLTEDASPGVVRVYGLFKPDGVLVGAFTYKFFTPGEAYILHYTIHPDHRNQGHTRAFRGLGLVGLFGYYNITTFKAKLEASSTFPAMEALKTFWNSGGANLEAGDSMSTEGRLDKDGNSVALKLMTATRAQVETNITTDPDWKDITYTFS